MSHTERQKVTDKTEMFNYNTFLMHVSIVLTCTVCDLGSRFLAGSSLSVWVSHEPQMNEESILHTDMSFQVLSQAMSG